MITHLGHLGKEDAPVLRYWPIKIGLDGLDSENMYYGQVHRNVVYQISATIAGNGYADPTQPKDDPTATCLLGQWS